MRAHIAAGLIALVAAAIAFDALAQGYPGGILGQGQGQTQPRAQGKQQPPRAPPPPIMRCADLAIGDYAIGALEPDAQPLSADEVSVRWEVRNAGGANYVGADASQQWVALEYMTPGGPQQLGVNLLPPGATPTPEGSLPRSVTLAPGGSWRGYIRATLPAEAARRPLRIKIEYGPRRGPSPDCDMDNNTAPLRR